MAAAKMTKAASALPLPLKLSLLFFVVLSSTSRSLVSAASSSSVAASSSRALARREALLRASSGSQSVLDHAAQSRNRRKRAALARRGAIIVDDDGDSDRSSNLVDRFEFSDEEKLLNDEQEEFQQQQLEWFGDEFGAAASGSSASSTSTAASASAKPVTADSSFTSTYGVLPPPRDAATSAAAATTAAATAATTATTTASSSAATTTAAASKKIKKKPIDDILVVINTPHYLGDGYAAPVEGCKRTVIAEEERSPASPASSSSSSPEQKTTTTIPLRCEFSADASKVPQAQALWYHLPHTGLTGPYAGLPRAENGGNPFTARPETEQVAVAATMESAAYYPNILDEGFMAHFAVESSYRLRSGAMLAYFGEPHVQLWTNLSSIKSFAEKKAAIGYVSSNCGAPSGRDGIVGKLMDMAAAAATTATASGEEEGGNQASSSSSSSRGLRATTVLAEGSAGHEFATKLLEKPHLLTDLQREQLLRQVGGAAAGGGGGGAGGGGGGGTLQQQQQQALGHQGQQQQQPQHQQRPATPLSVLPVHSFGRCRSNMPTAPTGGQVAVMRDYRFCVAMENSIAEDYVTEKVYAALDAGCLPIYYGAPNGLDFVPVPESVIDYRAIGGTPEALMAEIARLNADEAAYEAKVTAWRKAGPAGWNPKFLSLRERANEMGGQCAVCLRVAEALERNREIEEEEKREKGGSAAAATTTAAAASKTPTTTTAAAASASSTSAALPVVNHMAASRRFIDGLEQQQEVPAAAAASERGEVSM